MKQVYQQIISSENGDCMKATLCSLLELEYDSVCNFVEYEDWWQRMESALNDNGYAWGNLGLHMVVIDANCNIVFDPNPEYVGIDHYPLSRLLGFNGIFEAWGVKKLSNNTDKK